MGSVIASDVKVRERAPERSLTECPATTTPTRVECAESTGEPSLKRHSSQLSIDTVLRAKQSVRDFRVQRGAEKSALNFATCRPALTEFVDSGLLKRIVFSYFDRSLDVAALQKRIHEMKKGCDYTKEESARVPLTFTIEDSANGLATIEVQFEDDSLLLAVDSGQYSPKWHLKFAVLSALTESDTETLLTTDNKHLLHCNYGMFETSSEHKLLQFDTVRDNKFFLKTTPSLTRTICFVKLRLEVSTEIMSQWSPLMHTVIEPFEDASNELEFDFNTLVQYRRAEDSLWTEAIVLSHEKGTEDGTEDGVVRLIQSQMAADMRNWGPEEMQMLFVDDYKRSLNDESKRRFESFLSANRDQINEFKAELRVADIMLPQVIECRASEVQLCSIGKQHIVDISDRFEVESRALLSGFKPLTEVLATYSALISATQSLAKNADFVPFLVTEYLFEREFRVRFDCFECSRSTQPSAVLRPTVVWSAIVQNFAEDVQHSEGDSLPEFILKDCILCHAEIQDCCIAYTCPKSHDFCLNCITRIVLMHQAISQALSDCLSDTLNDDCLSEITHFVVGVLRF